jgi:hypothetical protein
LPMTDVAICLRLAADCLACARLCPSEADVAREYADMAVADLPADLAAQVERALDCGDYRMGARALDGLANTLEPPAALTPEPRSRRPRKPSLARLVAKAKQLGVDVTVEPDGAVTFRTGNSASAAVDKPQTELAEWIAKHAH